MFFSKSDKSTPSNTKPDWSLKDKELINNITGNTYNTSDLAYALKKDGHNAIAAIWYKGQFLCNLTTLYSQSGIYKNHGMKECDAFIEGFDDTNLADLNSNEIEISLPYLKFMNKEFGLAGIRTQQNQNHYDVLYYGKYLTQISESVANTIEKAKDIHLTRKYGVNGSKAKQDYDKQKIEHAIASKLNKVEAKDVLLTTETALNLNITKRIDVITAECAYGMNIFKDIFASFSDTFGGRSNSIQNTLRDARQTALTELRKEAISVGANAVIGIDLDYSEISGGGKSGMLFIVASGTAVIIEN
ncbi:MULTISPECIES: YbjQ family protein [unclassified Pseudoalteromonas]|uniref:YbjQ family protein n=1 Tax=unclassified Pseudoalteromonas TaxID=194690 RepID=UPI0021757ACE|nr:MULTISPECIES: YbjQ family protein [unclassified Pseudoalteromonas]